MAVWAFTAKMVGREQVCHPACCSYWASRTSNSRRCTWGGKHLSGKPFNVWHSQTPRGSETAGSWQVPPLSLPLPASPVLQHGGPGTGWEGQAGLAGLQHKGGLSLREIHELFFCVYLRTALIAAMYGRSLHLEPWGDPGKPPSVRLIWRKRERDGLNLATDAWSQTKSQSDACNPKSWVWNSPLTHM